MTTTSSEPICLDEELLRSQAHVWNHIFNFINSMSLRCAIELGIPDVINSHGGSMTITELIEALPINKGKSHCVFRLMRILVNSKFYAMEKGAQGECYTLTLSSRLLLKDNPMSMRPLLLAMLDPMFTNPWNSLSKWFQNDDPTPFSTTHGWTIWEYAGREPKLNSLFNEAMASDARLVTTVMIRECKHVFEGLSSLADIGGGTGTVSKGIAEAFPEVQCISFDLPHVVAGLKGSDNLSYVGGDMLDAVPRAQAVLLKWILHDWADEECVKILKNCKEAISSKEEGGKVIIIDMVMQNKKEDEELLETQLLIDMVVMTFYMGKERNEEEWAKLFSDAGFNDYKITPVLGLRSLIEVYP